MMAMLRRGSGPQWKRVFRGVRPGENGGKYWTPCPIAALTFVDREGGQLLVGTLRLRDLAFRQVEAWTHDNPCPVDACPTRGGPDIQWYRDRAMCSIFWHFGENRRVDLRGVPEVRDVAGAHFVAYCLVSEKARQSLKVVRTFPYSDELVAAVLRANGRLAR